VTVSLQPRHSMSTTPPPSNPPNNPEKELEPLSSGSGSMDVAPDQPPQVAAWEDIPDDVLSSTTEEILTRIRLIENDIKVSQLAFNIPDNALSSTIEEILTRIRLIENDIKVCRPHSFALRFRITITMQVMRSETLRLQHEQSVMKEKIRDNGEKIKQNKVLPYLVGNVVEVVHLAIRNLQLSHLPLYLRS